MKVRSRGIRARPNFYMISDNPNISLGIVDWSLYTRRIALKKDSHEKRMDILAYAPVEFMYLETLAKPLIIPARQKQFIQGNIFNKAPVPRIAIAMNTNSALTGSYIENQFWYQQFDLEQFWLLREGQPIVDFDAADNCWGPDEKLCQRRKFFVSTSEKSWYPASHYKLKHLLFFCCCFIQNLVFFPQNYTVLLSILQIIPSTALCSQ